MTLAGLAFAAASGCGSSGGGGGSCALSTLTCGAILPDSELMTLQPGLTTYDPNEMLPCQFTLQSDAGGIFQAFCGDAKLLMTQVSTAMTAYPTATIMETDMVGTKSWEIVLGEPMTTGSFAEIAALTTNGKYVFDVSMESAASDIAAVRPLAAAINTHLSAH